MYQASNCSSSAGIAGAELGAGSRRGVCNVDARRLSADIADVARTADITAEECRVKLRSMTCISPPAAWPLADSSSTTRAHFSSLAATIDSIGGDGGNRMPVGELGGGGGSRSSGAGSRMGVGTGFARALSAFAAMLTLAIFASDKPDGFLPRGGTCFLPRGGTLDLLARCGTTSASYDATPRTTSSSATVNPKATSSFACSSCSARSTRRRELIIARRTTELGSSCNGASSARCGASTIGSNLASMRTTTHRTSLSRCLRKGIIAATCGVMPAGSSFSSSPLAIALASALSPLFSTIASRYGTCGASAAGSCCDNVFSATSKRSDSPFSS
mmetsp:Transcript_19063/g.42600  ORF Transcript_19063/g.42600 Transcript_19063/m.42600 type:complete len:331 (-) Transcript_19063:475-1467(-)